MTILETTPRVRLSGNGTTTIFPFAFPVLNVEHIEAILTDEQGEDTPLVRDVDYTVELMDGSGNVIVAQPVLSGVILTISRNVPLSQAVEVDNQGGFFPETHEDVFDYLTMIDQQQQEQIDRAVKVSNTSGATSEDLRTDLYQARDEAIDAATSSNSSAVLSSESETASDASATSAALSATEAQAARDAVVVSLYEGIATDGQTAIDISSAFSALDADKENVAIFINGIRVQTSAWTRSSDTVIILDNAMSVTDIIEVYSATASGVINTHSNMSQLDLIANAGSGNIITTDERIALHSHINKSAIDKIPTPITENDTHALTWDNTNDAFTFSPIGTVHLHTNKSVLDTITNAGSGNIITSDERTAIATNTASITGLQGAVVRKGEWDASGGTYPTTATTGDYYVISTAGTIEGTEYDINDWITKNDSGWDKTDNSDKVFGVLRAVITTDAELRDALTTLAQPQWQSGEFVIVSTISMTSATYETILKDVRFYGVDTAKLTAPNGATLNFWGANHESSKLAMSNIEIGGDSGSAFIDLGSTDLNSNLVAQFMSCNFSTLTGGIIGSSTWYGSAVIECVNCISERTSASPLFRFSSNSSGSEEVKINLLSCNFKTAVAGLAGLTANTALKVNVANSIIENNGAGVWGRGNAAHNIEVQYASDSQVAFDMIDSYPFQRPELPTQIDTSAATQTHTHANKTTVLDKLPTPSAGDDAKALVWNDSTSAFVYATPSSGGGEMLSSDTTVSIPAGSTKAQVQALIDGQPKNLGGYTLTFEFEDGTYTGSYVFSGFYAGQLNVFAETPISTAGTSQNVILNGTSETSHVLSFVNNNCGISVSSIRTLPNTNASSTANGFSGVGNPGYTGIQYCSALGNGLGAGLGSCYKWDGGAITIGSSYAQGGHCNMSLVFANARVASCTGVGTADTNFGLAVSYGTVCAYQSNTFAKANLTLGGHLITV